MIEGMIWRTPKRKRGEGVGSFNVSQIIPPKTLLPETKTPRVIYVLDKAACYTMLGTERGKCTLEIREQGLG